MAQSSLSKILTSSKPMAKFPLNSTGSQLLPTDRGPFSDTCFYSDKWHFKQRDKGLSLLNTEHASAHFQLSIKAVRWSVAHVPAVRGFLAKLLFGTVLAGCRCCPGRAARSHCNPTHRPGKHRQGFSLFATIRCI